MTILYIRITTSCNATRIYIVHQQMLVICSNKRKIAAFFSILLLRHTHSARPMHTAHCNTRSHWLNYMEEKWLGWWTAYAIDTWSVFCCCCFDIMDVLIRAKGWCWIWRQIVIVSYHNPISKKGTFFASSFLFFVFCFVALSFVVNKFDGLDFVFLHIMNSYAAIIV